MMLFSDTGNLSERSDPILWFMEIFATIGIPGGVGLIAWNMWEAWRGDRRWTAKLWSLLLFLAALIVLWVGLVFNLIGFGVNY